MKDYSLNPEQSKQFIRGYKIVNNNIIAKLANGENYIIPYTEENEQIILERMEKQARNAEVKDLSLSSKALAITQPLILPVPILNFINNGGVFYGVLLVGVGLSAVVFPLNCLLHKLKERDIEKLNYFLDNQQELNDNIRKSENMLLGVSRKSKRQIQQTPTEEPVFSINNIDNYSYSDLKALRENILRISNFAFQEQQITDSEEKGYAKVLIPQKPSNEN